MRTMYVRVWLALTVLTALLASPAAAQQFTGRIEVTVVDATGGVLPGVTVELAGPRADLAVSGADGMARFLNLPPGTYAVKASLQSFSDYLNNEVPVVAGGNVQLRVQMRVGGVQEQVEVTAETPVIDAKKTGTSTAVTLDELQNIPSARDPWVVMQTVPGVVMDRVNVGGGESGQQSQYLAKGASLYDSTWSVDGVPVTDMSATGSSVFYYDFDMFQEMSVSTGGSDLTSSTSGVALNMVLKSGTNTPHGSARIYFENQDMQSNNMDRTLATNLGSPNGKGNRIEKYQDYGFELGGPIWKDKIWGWGSYGKTDIELLTIRQTPDKTYLKNAALKFTGQITPTLRAGYTYFWGDKNKFGRGASATRPPETTVDQKGPSPVHKGEVNWVAGTSLFLTGRVGYVGGGFSMFPQGGLEPAFWQDDSGVFHGSYWDYYTERPQYLAMAEGNYFKGRHEVKFGYSWRKVSVESYSHTPGPYQIWSIHVGYPEMIAQAVSYWASGAEAHYQSAWAGDTISLDRATINVGARFDWQDDGQLSVSEPAVPGFEQWLPAITGPAVPKAIKWNSFSPRVGMTYALDEARRTQLRGSYAMFASQLPNGESYYANVVQYRYVYFYATDLNGNQVAEPNEIDFASGPAGWGGFNINDPSALTTINKNTNYSVPKTHEVIFGVDHELFRNFGVSASFTYRYYNDFNWRPRNGVRSGDYVQTGAYEGGPLPDGSNFSVPIYTVDTSKLSPEALAGGYEYTSREGYHQRFWGIEASATKRLADRWMLRVGFSTNDHREYFDDRATAIEDPTPMCIANRGCFPLVDGGLVSSMSTASGKSGIYMSLPKYQFLASGLYQAPWGVDLGFNLVSRQGYTQPWFRSRAPGSGDYFGSSKNVMLVSDIGKNRMPSVTTLDLRVGKEFRFGRTSVSVDLDVFNLLNSGTVLQRQYDYRLTGATGFNQTLEILSPRVARIGARFSF